MVQPTLRSLCCAAVGVLLSFRAVGAADLPAQSSFQTNAPARAVSPAQPPWGRIVLIGASVSAGFTESEPLGGPQTKRVRLSRYLDAALRVPHEPVRSFANPMFFFQPEAEARKQLFLATNATPTLIVGVDFLFWFCYGDGPTDAARARRFEQGLSLLEPVTSPLLLGDIPDASIALDAALSQEQIPSAAAIAAANRRLKEWAARHPQVTIVPLASLMRSVTANQALRIHAHEVPAGRTRALLQTDKLHPSPAGCAILALTTLDAFIAARPTLPPADVCWDPTEVLHTVLPPSPASAQTVPKPGKT